MKQDIIKILLLDNDPHDIELLQYELKKAGLKYINRVVQTKPEFENALKDFYPDVILSEYSLPDFDGPSVFRIACEIFPTIPFIFVAGTIGDENEIELIKQGATDYVLKEKMYQVVPKIQRALREARQRREKELAEHGLTQSLHKLQKTEKNLRETNRKISNILESIGDGFFSVNCTWAVTYWNKAAEKITGVPREQIVGKNLWDLFDRNVYPISYANYNKALTRRVPVHFEDYFPPLNAWIGISVYPSEDGISAYFKDITEKVLADKALRQSEKKQRLIMAAALDAIVCMDPEGCVTFWNSQAEKIFGWKTEEAIGQKLSQLIVPERWREKYEKGLKKYLQTGDGPVLNNVIEMQAIDKKNKVFTVEMSIVPVQEADNYFFCGFIRDITARKKAERKLIESEIGLKRAQALAHVGSWELDFINNTTVWSDETYRILGYEPGEMPPTKETYFARIHPEDAEEVKSIIAKSETALQPYSFVHRIVRESGDIRYVLSESEYVIDPDGKPVSIHGVFLDITQEKLQEELLARKNAELKGSEEKYRDMFFKSPLPMWVFDLQTYQFLDVNEAAVRHYGYSRGEFLSMSIRDIRPPEDLPILEKEVKEVAKKLTYNQGVFRHIKKNGDIIQVQVQANSINFQGATARLILAIDFSEKLKAEEALLQSEQRFKLLVQEGSDLISILNPEGVYQYVSPTSERILGIEPESFIGKNAFDFIHPEDAASVLSQFESLLIHKRAEVAPFRFKNGKGEWRWIETTATNMTDDPVVAGIVANSRDITETYIIQAEIKKVKDSYEAVARATSDAIYESDLATNKLLITGSGFKHLFGYDLENCEVNVNFMSNMLHPDDREKVYAVYEKALQSLFKRQWSVEYRFLKADGSYTYVLNRFSVIFEDVLPIKVLGTIQDIDGRKQAELQLVNSEKRFRALIENSTDGLTTISADKKVLDVSPSGKRILGYDKEEYIGVDRSELIHPDDRQLVDDCFEAVLKDPNDIRIIEYRFRKANGEYTWVESTFHNQLSNPYIRAVVLNYRDFTERKKQEQEREQLIKELTQNYQDLKQFSFITSHNLRAPLCNLLSILELMDISNITDKETLKFIELFHHSTHQLNETINDLVKILVIKQNPDVGKNDISLQDQWEKVTKMVQGELEPVDPIIEASFGDAPKVYFNPVYLESVFLNLLTNSLKYRSPERRLKLQITSREEENYTVLTFADNGRGVDIDRYSDRIFGLYQRFHAHTEGKGIGLYIVHSQISALGGKIEVEGGENEGLRFTVYFKRKEKDAG